MSNSIEGTDENGGELRMSVPKSQRRRCAECRAEYRRGVDNQYSATCRVCTDKARTIMAQEREALALATRDVDAFVAAVRDAAGCPKR